MNFALPKGKCDKQAVCPGRQLHPRRPKARVAPGSWDTWAPMPQAASKGSLPRGGCPPATSMRGVTLWYGQGELHHLCLCTDTANFSLTPSTVPRRARSFWRLVLLLVQSGWGLTQDEVSGTSDVETFPSCCTRSFSTSPVVVQCRNAHLLNIHTL